MARNATWSTAARNAGIDAKAVLLNGGFLRVYTAPQPTGPDTAITTQVLLAELRFNAMAFAPSVNGVATANAIVSDTDANATGAAAWLRCVMSDGTTAVHDATIGTSGANGTIANTSIVQHGIVDCPGFTITDAPASAL